MTQTSSIIFIHEKMTQRRNDSGNYVYQIRGERNLKLKKAKQREKNSIVP